MIVAVCDSSPHGVARFLGWSVEALALAPRASFLVAVNRAPGARFRRGELHDEITTSLASVPGVLRDVRVESTQVPGRDLRNCYSDSGTKGRGNRSRFQVLFRGLQGNPQLAPPALFPFHARSTALLVVRPR